VSRCVCAWAVVCAAAPAAAQQPADPTPEAPAAPPPAAAPKIEAAWDNGLFFRTPDEDYVFHLGGVGHYDAVWYSAADALQLFPGGPGRFRDGVTPRRLRLLAEGTVARDYDFLFQVEFANAVGGTPADVTFTPGPLDVWVTVKDVPLVGNVRIGNQKEWFSLEHLNSARFLEFVERSYLFDAAQPSAFNNGRTPGVSVFRTWLGGRVFTGVGAYKNIGNVFGFGVGDGEYAVTGRVTGLPVYRPDDRALVHVGGAMSYRDPVGGRVRVRARSDLRSSPFSLLNLVADTGPLDAGSQLLFDLESAAVYGPVTLQGEYLASIANGVRVGGRDLGSVPFQGFYAEGLVFLTGESRTWNAATATFDRVVPRRNFGFRGRGPGAVELAARVSELDLARGGVFGGRLRSVTLGMNWYWNPNVKVQANYDYTYRDESADPAVKGSIHAFGTRLALDF
jgi:phosphate-selective porin OprO/OprP